MARIRTSLVVVSLTAAASPATWVFAYELPVLEAIHGELDTQLIRVVDESTVEVDIDNVHELYSTMQAKYGKKGGDVVKSVYPDRRAFERALNASIEDEEEPPKRKAAKKAAKKDDPPPEDDSGEGDQIED